MVSHGGGKYLGGKAWLSNCCPTELDLVNLLFFIKHDISGLIKKVLTKISDVTFSF